MNESSDSANPLVLNLDTSIYSLPAIMNAAYDYGEKATIKVEKLSEERILVSLVPKSGHYSSSATLADEFKNLLIDHQVRVMVSRDYQVIREIIVAQAFQPCENLKDIIELLKP